MKKCVDNKSMCKGPKDQNKCMDSLFCYRRIPWSNIEDMYILSYLKELDDEIRKQDTEHIDFTKYALTDFPVFEPSRSDYSPTNGRLSNEEINRINSQALQQTYDSIRRMEQSYGRLVY